MNKINLKNIVLLILAIWPVIYGFFFINFWIQWTSKSNT